MTKRKFADLSKFQPASKGFFLDLKNRLNVSGAVIQLSYSANPAYDNPNASYQVYNAYKTFGLVSAYHYYMGMPVTEAKHFLSLVKKYGLDTNTLLAIDIEDQSLSGNLTEQVNKFLDVLYDHGYHNLAVYSGNSFFTTRLRIADFKHKPLIWVASYGTRPSIKHDAWQYTESAQTAYGSVDLSYDTTNKFTTKPKTVNFVQSGKKFKVINHVHLYHQADLKKPLGTQLGDGSVVHGKIVKHGSKYRVKTLIGYISACKDYIKKVD